MLRHDPPVDAVRGLPSQPSEPAARKGAMSVRLQEASQPGQGCGRSDSRIGRKARKSPQLAHW